MRINKNASLIAKNTIIVNAPLKNVWKIQTDINHWPDWQKDVSTANLQGKLIKGSKFYWKAKGVGINSKLQEVVEGKKIGWSGKSIGMDAIHIWRFEIHGTRTKVITEESLSGLLPEIIKIFQPDFLEKSLSKSLQILKNRAESTVTL